MKARSTPTRQEPATASDILDEGPLQPILGYRLAQATVVTNRIFESQVAEVLDLRKVEYTVLTLVQQNEGLTAAQLASELAFTAPNMAAWIDRLSRRGLVEREQHSRDRRALHIRTTAAGRELAKRATQAIRAAEAQVLSVLSPGEQLMLFELLQKVASCRAQVK